MKIYIHPMIAEFAGKIRGNIDVFLTESRIGIEERSWQPALDAEYDLNLYISMAEHAVDKAKTVDTYEERLYWLGEAKRSILRFHKVYRLLNSMDGEP